MTTPSSTIAYQSDEVTLHHGDCLDVLAALPDASVDSVVTDPPYGLEFMGREWDGADGFRRSLNKADVGRESVFGRASRTSPEYRAGGLFQEWCEAWARECLRILKPGGHMLAFGGTRTWHRLAVAVEDAGFEVRDSMAWMYGSGFPKSMNVGDGLGTALKPAFEPIVMARKPLIGTVAANLAEHGTGALNIDASRIPSSDSQLSAKYASVQNAGSRANTVYGTDTRSREGSAPHEGGRFPTNVILDERQATELDAQSGTTRSCARTVNRNTAFGVMNDDGWSPSAQTFEAYDDVGGASRFFYTAKADSAERPVVDGIAHPTVKPLDLMRYLVRLVTPKGGVVLEPFAGSGTTLEAAVLEGFRAIGIEREADYIPLITKRLDKPHTVGLDLFGDAA